jgi:hypothetical protein
MRRQPEHHFLLPAVPDEAPEAVREGLTRRNLVAIGERCPCGGGRTDLGPRGPQHGFSVPTWHASDCPASDPVLLVALWRWLGYEAEIPQPVVVRVWPRADDEGAA